MLDRIKQEDLYRHSSPQIHLSEALQTNYAMLSMPGNMATFPLQGIAYCRRSNLVNYYEVKEKKLETGFSILREHRHFISKHNFLSHGY